MQRVSISIILVLLFGMIFSAQAQGQPESVLQDVCPYSSGTHFQPGVFPRYELRNQRLLLVSWTTGKVVREVETSLNTSRFIVMGWSPDCRYLTAALGQSDTAVWDVVAAQRVGTFPGSGLRWSPDSQQAVLSQSDGLYLWTVGAGDPLRLTNFRGDYVMDYWDTARSELWLMVYSTYYSSPGVTVYDRQTGQQIAYYDNPAGQSRQIGFTFSTDGSRVIVYTIRAQDSRSAGVTIWERGTNNHIDLPVGSEAAAIDSRIALSPDGRYLVIGRHFLRVWDLTALPDSLDARTPAYFAGPTAVITQVSFVDNAIIETLDSSGSRQRWDITTGEAVPVA